MLSILFFTKLSAVITVLYAGMNLHQLTSSYAYLSEKIEQFRALLAQSEGSSGLIRLNIVFYAVLPIVYLAMLRVSEVESRVLGALAIKFAYTAFMDIRAERRIMVGGEYSPRQHAFSRIDNVLNLAAAAGVIYVLMKPIGLFS
ncbi:MAG: hypothetical protein JWO30_1954 [Fibrobacteres bacterium]|nr:hypothetical protein [Fibrobacterota bacterium]